MGSAASRPVTVLESGPRVLGATDEDKFDRDVIILDFARPDETAGLVATSGTRAAENTDRRMGDGAGFVSSLDTTFLPFGVGSASRFGLFSLAMLCTLGEVGKSGLRTPALSPAMADFLVEVGVPQLGLDESLVRGGTTRVPVGVRSAVGAELRGVLVPLSLESFFAVDAPEGS